MDRVREALRRALPALGMYAAARLTGMTVMAAWAWWIGKHPRTLLGHLWDGIWYTGIARNGYGLVLPSPTTKGVIFNDLAFFPLYPGLVRAVATVLPLTVVSAGLLVAWASAALAAWGVYAVGERLYGRRAGTFLVLLWGLLPHAIVQTMAYTESLMTALAAWALYALLTGRWLWAGAWRCWRGCHGPTPSPSPPPSGAPSRWRCGGMRGPGGTGGRGRRRVWPRWAGPATSCGRASARATARWATSRCSGGGGRASTSGGTPSGSSGT
ncbi:hypothetical protein [Streptomyces cinnamoneus]|uniref:hypothetical protein n=1 Tax=Streptomyces cinnamoneus TaxID=53446 RepID=UPI0030B8C573